VRQCKILGVRVDGVTHAELLSGLDEFVASKQPHQIVTLNPEMLVAAQADTGFQAMLNQADLRVADGVGLMLAARLLGCPLPERITGSDEIYRLASHCAVRGYRPYLLGAAPGVAEKAAERLLALNPGLKMAGTFAGSPRAEEQAEIIGRIRATEPEVLFVAFGVPAEEIWIARNREPLGVPVMMGVGGAFDFAAGVARRAPNWMRRAGLEWLHRLAREPWRWRRQLALPRFVFLVLRQRLAGH